VLEVRCNLVEVGKRCISEKRCRMWPREGGDGGDMDGSPESVSHPRRDS
jgi:hypothetical protein